MLEFFQYATSGFWTFAGVVFLIVVIGVVVADLIKAVRSRAP